MAMKWLQFWSTVIAQGVLLTAATWLIRQLVTISLIWKADYFRAELERTNELFRLGGECRDTEWIVHHPRSLWRM